MRESAIFFCDLLKKLPEDHPERADVEALAHIAESLGKRRDGRLEALPTPEQLVSQEKEAWKRFFGREIKVPNPPQELLDTLTRVQELGITVFEAHFLPKVELKQDLKAPSWKIRPEEWYWQQIEKGNVAKDATKLGGVWVLIDGSQKPDYDSGRQQYQNDPLAPILTDLRREGKIEVPSSYKYVPETSRFATSYEEISDYVIPAVTNFLNVEREQVRMPCEIEFNVLGNLHHPEWGQTTTWERFGDIFGGDCRLIGGGSDGGGLALVRYRWSGYRVDCVGFRLLVEFPSKS